MLRNNIYSKNTFRITMDAQVTELVKENMCSVSLIE